MIKWNTNLYMKEYIWKYKVYMDQFNINRILRQNKLVVISNIELEIIHTEIKLSHVVVKVVHPTALVLKLFMSRTEKMDT